MACEPLTWDSAEFTFDAAVITFDATEFCEEDEEEPEAPPAAFRVGHYGAPPKPRPEKPALSQGVAFLLFAGW